MNTIQKSETTKNGLRKGFQDGSSKMAKRRCYGYTINPDGELEINPDKAKVVSWIFERYLAGDSLGKIAAGLEKQSIPSPTGRPKWNREAIDKLLSNEKYTGRYYYRRQSALALSKSQTTASWNGIFTSAPMGPLFLMKCFWQCSKQNSAAQKIRKTRLP